MHGNCKHSCRGKFWKIGLLVIAGIAVLGLIVMLLWNWLMPELFIGVHTISYLQALGILVLSKILFGGLRGHGCHGRWHRHHRCHSLSEEERAKMKESCGCGGSSDSGGAGPQEQEGE